MQSSALERLVAEFETENLGLLSLAEKQQTQLARVEERLHELKTICAELSKAVSKL